ncbi:MAG: nucleotidyltransferase family protein [Peptococcaceae bacterium]|nr:nucleotidyltransferase family protein [Peptococcaceae bacterium]
MTKKTRKPVAAIIMASGFSRRMGTNKLALQLDSRTVIEHVMDQVGALRYEPVIVVSQYDQILLWADERGFYPLANPYAAEGKSSSIRLGACALETLTAEGKFQPAVGMAFFTGDQILLSDDLLRDLIDTFLAQPDRVVFPVYDGEAGSPAIFPVDMIPRLKKLEEEEGGMKAARECEDRIIYVPAMPGWQGMDFDTAEDWEKVKALWAASKSIRG